MKKIIIGLILLAVFFACASAGYELAKNTLILSETVSPINTGQASTAQTPDQSCILLIQVDRLDVKRPRLVSAWAGLIYSPVEMPLKLSVKPVYFSGMQSKEARALEQAFVMNDKGEPGSGFWKAFSAYQVTCQDYIMVDEYALVKTLNWIENRTNMADEIGKAAGDPDAAARIVESACSKVVGMNQTPMAPFKWSDLAPGHIRTSLRWEAAELYWEKITAAPQQSTCQ